MKKGFRAMKQAAFAFMFFLTLSAFGEENAAHSAECKECAFASAKPISGDTMKEKIICIPAEGKEEEIRGY